MDRAQIPISSILVGLLVFSACALGPPLEVHPASPQKVRREQQVNALSSGQPSYQTRIVLRRHDLSGEFGSNRAQAIARLHELVAKDEGTSDVLFALAELSFLYATKQVDAGQAPRSQIRPPPSRRRYAGVHTPAENAALRATGRSYYLASAVYAWAFLFSDRERDAIPLIDPRTRLAADIYNHALSAAFTRKGQIVELRAGVYPLPFGTLDVSFDPASLVWGTRRLDEFLPVGAFEVRGLANRYRQPGIGAPLVARAVALDPVGRASDLQLAQTMVSATAVLRLEEPWRQLRETSLTGRLDLYKGRESSSLELAGRKVPLEIEPSAALAATLETSGVWRGEISAFLGRALGMERPPRLFALEPAMPGQIPVVFVHGTSSNPAIWANMVNDLRSEPQVRDRFAFWFFSYDSGNPILYSGMNLRRALHDAISELGLDAHPCLRDMVVIGHSQGGLLAKLTAIDSGSRFWHNISRKPFDKVKFRQATRVLLRDALFVQPLPFVARVVFIATPHRGSFLASPGIVRRLGTRLIRLPSDVVEVSTDLARLSESAKAELRIARVSTSLDNMSPGDVFIKTLAEIPVAAGVADNSIVAVRGEGPPEGKNDGVVRFSSAHLSDVESELIVRSGHSTLSNPHTINEVERILGLHAGSSTCRSQP